MDRDWTGLLLELLQPMSKKLTSISDFIRLQHMCTRWKELLSDPPDHLPPQVTWLILLHGPDDDGGAYLGSSLSMYELSQSRTHILDLPAVQGKRICGSSHGWLVLEKERMVCLLNPITRDEIILPFLSIQPNSFQGNTKGAAIRSNHRFCIKNSILSSNPLKDSNCLVMALFAGSWKTAFCRIGDECWTTVFVQGSTAPESPTVDIGYHNNLFYAICRNGHAWICNICNRHLNCVSSLLDDREACLCTVEGGGDGRRFMIIFWKYLTNECWLLMLSVEEETWLQVDQEHSVSNIFFLGGFFHCIAIPTANPLLDGWVGGSICYFEFETESAEMVGGANRIRCSLMCHEKIDDASVVSTLATNLYVVVDPNSNHRHAKSPYFLWLTPTLC